MQVAVQGKMAIVIGFVLDCGVREWAIEKVVR
jgi:hypothetical protein